MIKLWKTPFVDANSLFLVDLRYFYDDRVEICVAEPYPCSPERHAARTEEETAPELRRMKEKATLVDVGPESRKWVIEVPWQFVALQVIDESLYQFSEKRNVFGHSYIWTDSAWQAEFTARHTLTKTLRPDTNHYIVATSFDVIDILSDTEPTIKTLFSA